MIGLYSSPRMRWTWPTWLSENCWRERRKLVWGCSLWSGEKPPLSWAHTIARLKIISRVNLQAEIMASNCIIFVLPFPGSRVFVARVARQTKTREYKDLDAHFTANLGYSHHQKSVILDAPQRRSKPNGRRIVAFVGGIDLTGKWRCTSENNLQTFKGQIEISKTALFLKKKWPLKLQKKVFYNCQRNDNED